MLVRGMSDPLDPLDLAQDARLVEWCLAGDPRAWESLVRRHARLVHAVARRYSLPEPDLQDVVQDVFTALVKGLPQLRDGRALRGWLVATSDRIARAAALRTRRERALQDQSPDAAESVASNRPSVMTALETLEEQAVIRHALSSMPDACRRLIVALYYEDPQPSYAELSQRWRMPIGSLGPTRARCIERLRKTLKKLLAEDAGITTSAEPTSEKTDSTNDSLERGGGRSPILDGEGGLITEMERP
jgi:RNA polymerase sigma factor (sigma-70 family)